MPIKNAPLGFEVVNEAEPGKIDALVLETEFATGALKLTPEAVVETQVLFETVVGANENDCIDVPVENPPKLLPEFNEDPSIVDATDVEEEPELPNENVGIDDPEIALPVVLVEAVLKKLIEVEIDKLTFAEALSVIFEVAAGIDSILLKVNGATPLLDIGFCKPILLKVEPELNNSF